MIVGRRPHRTPRRITRILHINCRHFSGETKVYSVLLVGLILPPTAKISGKIRYMRVYATLRSDWQLVCRVGSEMPQDFASSFLLG